MLVVNGGSDNIEISPGGFIAYSSPVPDEGLESAKIVYTDDATVRVYILG
jgi:hypothetical protein